MEIEDRPGYISKFLMQQFGLIMKIIHSAQKLHIETFSTVRVLSFATFTEKISHFE